MKLAVVLPRGMVFSSHGATSIDLVARDLLQFSAYRDETLVLAPDAEEPYPGFNFVGLIAQDQKGRQQEILHMLQQHETIQTIVVHQHPKTAQFLKKHLPKANVILHRHGLLKKRKSWISRFLRQRAFLKLDHIIFVSEFLRQSFLQDYPALESKSSVLNNGVDPDHWYPAAEKKQEIVYLGRARQDKGILELLTGFRKLETKDWTLKLIIAVQTDAEREFADRVRQSLSSDEPIELIENLKSDDVRDSLAQAAIAALPSIVKEGFPRAVVEAMACGCATLATTSEGTCEATGDAALLLDEPTPAAIAEGLAHLTNDPFALQTWSEKARAHVVANLDIRTLSQDFDAMVQ